VSKCNLLLKLLLNKPRKSHTIEIYLEYNTLPLNVPQVIVNLFNPNSNIHDHNTRSKHDPHLNSNLNSKSLSFLGPSMWGKLPLKLRAIPSLNAFLSQYKSFLQQKL